MRRDSAPLQRGRFASEYQERRVRELCLDAASNADSGWINWATSPGYSNGWGDIGGQPLQYRKIGNAVFVRGGFTKASPDTSSVGTLATGFRPSSGFYAIVIQNGTDVTPGLVNVAAGGSLTSPTAVDSLFSGAGSLFTVD